MYWDHERQRYFPLPSRQAHPGATCSSQQKQPDLTQSIPAQGSIAIKRRRGLLTPYQALSDIRSVLRTVHKDALIHQIQSSQILLTDKATRSIIPPEGLLSAFQTVCHDGRVWSFVGDTLGWFYSSVVDKDHEEMDTIDGWQRQFHLSSEAPLLQISSIGVSGTTCVATSFGPECRILYVPLDSSVEGIHTTRIDGRIVHDVWTADLQGSRLVLGNWSFVLRTISLTSESGANKQAVVIEDIEVCASLQRLPTHSDVLALAQRRNILYTGLRNGRILQFDTRVQRSNVYPLFDSVSQCTSSITGLKHLHDYQLLVSFIDGGISTFDLRFPIRTPLLTFTGNFNTYTVRLPLATDPYEKFLFAAGQDNRIRLWSLITGGPTLHPDPGTSSINQTVFQRPFEHHVAALQVVEEREGMCLWAASGTELCKYNLGHRSQIKI
ncbi:hypothetical protein J3R83DRAFT_13001 [Lanmaoa asiatica]|nr:hypothetical protein J3R83DRAFT_13001 [Lanmaoa asiatica]